MANTELLDTPAFTIQPGTVTRRQTSSRVSFVFEAPAKRHLEGGFDATVHLLLLDGDDRFVARRYSDTAKTVLANRATWLHEIETDKLAAARRAVYEIQHRFDYRRKVCGGELPALTVEADGSDYWRWLRIDPRVLEDRAIKLDVGLWARNSALEITYSQSSKLVTDSYRSELELDLLDAEGIVVATKNFSISHNFGQPAYEDTSISMDRKTMHSLRFFELRARTEVRALVQLPIDVLPAS